jgi:hypothetical protein
VVNGRVLFVAAAVLAVLLVATGAFVIVGRPRTHEQVVTASGDLEAYVKAFVGQLPRPGSNGYRQPTPQQQTQMRSAWQALSQGRLEDALAIAAALRYDVVSYTDQVTGRTLAMLQEVPNADGSWPHAWGLFIVDPSSRSPLLVEVAHPVDDIDTPLVGVATFRTADARALFIAGASRFADPGDIADVAHDEFSMFEAVHEAALTPASIVFEPHGFEANDHGETGDLVVSSGTDQPDAVAKAAARALANDDFRVCVYEGGGGCGGLGATTNVQGASTRGQGAQFLHIEMTMAVRSTRQSREAVASAVADAIR